MEAICSSETPVDTQRTTRPYITEDGTLHLTTTPLLLSPNLASHCNSNACQQHPPRNITQWNLWFIIDLKRSLGQWSLSLDITCHFPQYLTLGGTRRDNMTQSITSRKQDVPPRPHLIAWRLRKERAKDVLENPWGVVACEEKRGHPSC
jgi:hypothetical protein